MTYAARVLADSVSPDEVRLTTLEVTFPRIVLAEFNTHRMLSRNSASSRAIPVQKMIERVLENPYIPPTWGKNQKGMQADVDLDDREASKAQAIWLHARDAAVEKAEKLLDVGVHKQLTNRLLEPFMWHTAIVTATEWDNFFHLRCHPDAHPDIRITAEGMRAAIAGSEPAKLDYGQWHLPLYDGILWGVEKDGTPSYEQVCKISIGRCARVSYLTHDGKRDPSKDVELADRLRTSGHMSPFEHVARPMTNDELARNRQAKLLLEDGRIVWVSGVTPTRIGGQKVIEEVCVTHFLGNFNGWVQYRKTIPGEHDMMGEQ